VCVADDLAPIPFAACLLQLTLTVPSATRWDGVSALGLSVSYALDGLFIQLSSVHASDACVCVLVRVRAHASESMSTCGQNSYLLVATVAASPFPSPAFQSPPNLHQVTVSDLLSAYCMSLSCPPLAHQSATLVLHVSEACHRS
jgi:hypothetical protein